MVNVAFSAFSMAIRLSKLLDQMRPGRCQSLRSSPTIGEGDHAGRMEVGPRLNLITQAVSKPQTGTPPDPEPSAVW